MRRLKTQHFSWNSLLPRYLPAEDVERLIHSCDPASLLGARDRAILL